MSDKRTTQMQPGEYLDHFFVCEGEERHPLTISMPHEQKPRRILKCPVVECEAVATLRDE